MDKSFENDLSISLLRLKLQEIMSSNKTQIYLIRICTFNSSSICDICLV